ncbi:LysM peptidoglycan-binding domain-containing protein [Nocardioides sambongensis]|uniref:LysM peptidoglycan-binding domain-containing protein n=1 Tax=Nocardioides sambongensis TaxID=2589074 RepID=UPI0011280133|nr:LysM peptidoglycan-binding domain-containing protein [Nocardioides sambongensis]
MDITSRGRAAIVWVVVSIATCGTLTLAVDALEAPAVDGADATADLIVLACTLGAIGAALRLWWVTTGVVAGLLRGRAPRPDGWLRRTLLTVCGVAVLSGTATAHAAPDLDGLPLPDRSTSSGVAAPGAGTSTDPAARDGREDHRPDAPDRVTVRPGDSLWALARALLGASADDTEVASYVVELHAANHDVIGSDPDLIRPGQVLDLPHRP